MLLNTVYWGVIVSIGIYFLCEKMRKIFKSAILNPLLFSSFFTIIFLSVFNIDYTTYYDKVSIIEYFLTPATVCLSISLYEQIKILKHNYKAIIIGVLSGIVMSMVSILLFSILFKFSHTMYITLLPKSVTAAIALGISEELGGISSLTVPIVIMTGITGYIIAEKVCNIFKIVEPIAVGLAIGSASHVMGTAKALEIGEIEGAMSSLSTVISGILTVIIASFFSHLY